MIRIPCIVASHIPLPIVPPEPPPPADGIQPANAVVIKVVSSSITATNLLINFPICVFECDCMLDVFECDCMPEFVSIALVHHLRYVWYIREARILLHLLPHLGLSQLDQIAYMHHSPSTHHTHSRLDLYLYHSYLGLVLVHLMV